MINLRKIFIMTDLIIQPLKDDVLCGKANKNYSNHAGNKLYRSLLLSYLDDYKITLTKSEKMNITKLIVYRMKNEYNTRFLRYDQTCNENKDGYPIMSWVELTEAQARDKTSHALRFLSKQNDIKTCSNENSCKKVVPQLINQNRNQSTLPFQKKTQVCYTENIDIDYEAPQSGSENFCALSFFEISNNVPLISASGIIERNIDDQLWCRQQEILQSMHNDSSSNLYKTEYLNTVPASNQIETAENDKVTFDKLHEIVFEKK